MRTGWIGGTLLIVLLLSAAAGSAGTQSAGDFDILYQESDSSQVPAVAESLASNLRTIQQATGLTLRRRLPVVLHQRDDFAKVAPPNITAQGSTAYYSLQEHAIHMLFGWTAARSMAAVRTDATLRHELTHAVVHSYIGLRPLPRWFEEGLAMYLQLGREGVAQQRLLVQQDARRNILVPLAESPYRVGVVAMDYLIERHGTTIVPAIVTRIEGRLTFSAAFAAAVGMSPEAYEHAFHEAMR